MRKFHSGATRDTAEDKYVINKFISPIVTQRFSEYMHHHRLQPDGNLREGDNWQKLFGDKHLDVCLESLTRHIEDIKLHHEGYKGRDDIESAICASIFNLNAYLFKLLKDRKYLCSDLVQKKNK